MKAPRIDFAPGAQRHANPLLVGLLVAGVLGCVIGVVLGGRYSHQAEQELAQAQDMISEKSSLDDAARRQEQVPAEVVDSVNAAVRMLNYPNIELLAQLERHATPDVQLISVEMGPVRTNLRLIVQAANTTQVLDYMDALKHESGFRAIALTHQEALNGGDGQSGWRFTLEVVQDDPVARAVTRPPRDGKNE